MADARASMDPDYPRIHVAAPVGRLNDPNGLVEIDGRFHVFYQFSPFFPERRLVFWGHATSTDLLHWENQAPALAPDQTYDRTGVYSGGAIVADDTVWFHYTGNVKHPDGTRETYQCAVTADLDLAVLRKHPANPLIPRQPDGYTAHFRDPQVWRDGDWYRMCIGAQREDETGCALLYRSDDLLTWEFEGELTFPGQQERFASLGYMWECPNLVPLTDEVTGESATALLFCPQGIEFADDLGHSAFVAGYVVGQVVGTEFRQAGPFVELDRGFEFYAPQCFSHSGPSDRTIMIGWAGNPAEDDQPSLADHGWVHTLTLPRELVLHAGRLRQRLAVDLPTTPLSEPDRTLTEETWLLDELTGVRSFVLDLHLTLEADAGCDIVLGTATSDAVLLRLAGGELLVDRTASRYPLDGRHTVQLPPGPGVQLNIVHDASITEIFVGDGEAVFTMRSFLGPGVPQVSLVAHGRVIVAEARASALA